jgi:hypothetical protein
MLKEDLLEDGRIKSNRILNKYGVGVYTGFSRFR